MEGYPTYQELGSFGALDAMRIVIRGIVILISTFRRSGRFR